MILRPRKYGFLCLSILFVRAFISTSCRLQYDNNERDQVRFSLIQPLNPFHYGGGATESRTSHERQSLEATIPTAAGSLHKGETTSKKSTTAKQSFKEEGEIQKAPVQRQKRTRPPPLISDEAIVKTTRVLPVLNGIEEGYQNTSSGSKFTAKKRKAMQQRIKNPSESQRAAEKNMSVGKRSRFGKSGAREVHHFDDGGSSGRSSEPRWTKERTVTRERSSNEERTSESRTPVGVLSVSRHAKSLRGVPLRSRGTLESNALSAETLGGGISPSSRTLRTKQKSLTATPRAPTATTISAKIYELLNTLKDPQGR